MRIIEQLQRVAEIVQRALDCNDEVRRIAMKYAECNNFLYLGRQFKLPHGLEGALKLKEISYIQPKLYRRRR